MGYCSDFNIKILTADGLPPDNFDQIINQIIKELSIISDYQIGSDGNGEAHLYEAKWYSVRENMREISEKHPALRFTVNAKGEDGELSIINAIGGVEDQRIGEVTFGPNTLWDESDKELRLFEVDFNDEEEHTLMVSAETPEEAVQLAADYYDIENGGFDVTPVAHEKKIRIFEIQANGEKGALGWHSAQMGGAVIEVASATMKEPV